MMMRSKVYLTFIFVLLLLCTSAFVSYRLWNDFQVRQRLQQVQLGIRETVASLPQLERLENVQIAFAETTRNDSKPCAYGYAFVLFGTTLPMKEATRMYIEALQQSGWELDDYQYETEKLLRRGTHERILLLLREPGPGTKDMVNYDEAKRKYPTILVVLPEYIIPSEKQC